jgi:hypothetical protein
MARDGIPEQINIRLNPECRAALEAYRAKREAAVKREMPTFHMSHTEALRLLIVEVLRETTQKP